MSPHCFRWCLDVKQVTSHYLKLEPVWTMAYLYFTRAQWINKLMSHEHHYSSKCKMWRMKVVLAPWWIKNDQYVVVVWFEVVTRGSNYEDVMWTNQCCPSFHTWWYSVPHQCIDEKFGLLNWHTHQLLCKIFKNENELWTGCLKIWSLLYLHLLYIVA